MTYTFRQLTSAPLKALSAILALVALSTMAAAQQGPGGRRPPPPPPTVNSAPVLVVPNGDLTAQVGVAFSYDASQGGSSFSDGDGDPLNYSLSITPQVTGLSADGATLSGTPSGAGEFLIVVTATDPRGASASDDFILTISAATSGTRMNTPQLPAELLNYANPGLPGYYRFGTIADADNTPEDNPITNAGATLGRVLFYDVKLSANDTVSCASCHQQAHGFSDPATLSTGFDGGQTARHSMGLTNARFYANGRFFWDERAETLEEQVLIPVQDSVEMGMTLTELEVKLQDTAYYAPLFEETFGDDTVTSDRIARALAQFVRSIVSTNSKFDSAFTGPGTDGEFEATFTEEELAGLVLFGQGGTEREGRRLGCAQCHGTRGHISDDIHNNGLSDGTTGDDGAGDGRFKAPSLRNIALTAPYMHDGRFETLEDVVDFYSTGIQDHPQLDDRLEAPGGQPRRINLTEAEKSALIAFLHTLTDDTLAADERFSDPFIAP